MPKTEKLCQGPCFYHKILVLVGLLLTRLALSGINVHQAFSKSYLAQEYIILCNLEIYFQKINFILFFCYKWYYLFVSERFVEDHEYVYNILEDNDNFPLDTRRIFYFRKDSRKYDVFEYPEVSSKKYNNLKNLLWYISLKRS